MNCFSIVQTDTCRQSEINMVGITTMEIKEEKGKKVKLKSNCKVKRKTKKGQKITTHCAYGHPRRREQADLAHLKRWTLDCTRKKAPTNTKKYTSKYVKKKKN